MDAIHAAAIRLLTKELLAINLGAVAWNHVAKLTINHSNNRYIVTITVHQDSIISHLVTIFQYNTAELLAPIQTDNHSLTDPNTFKNIAKTIMEAINHCEELSNRSSSRQPHNRPIKCQRNRHNS